MGLLFGRLPEKIGRFLFVEFDSLLGMRGETNFGWPSGVAAPC